MPDVPDKPNDPVHEWGDKDDVVADFCRIGAQVGEFLRLQRDCFCPGTYYDGFDPAITDWIAEAVRTRMLAEGWIDPATCEHVEWKRDAFMVSVTTTYHSPTESTTERRERLVCVACGAAKTGEVI